MKILTALITVGIFILAPLAHATNLPIRGIARGESGIKVGDKAPLVTPYLQKAHQEGKIIILMLGYPSHCPWCDKMDRYILAMMKETKNFNDRVAFFEIQTEHAKMILPHRDGPKLKEAYGVRGQPWFFLIDKEGTVKLVKKVFISTDELEKNIKELLKEHKAENS